MPHVLLVGRNSSKLEAISAEHENCPWSTNLDEALANAAYSIYFAAQMTLRPSACTLGRSNDSGLNVLPSIWTVNPSRATLILLCMARSVNFSKPAAPNCARIRLPVKCHRALSTQRGSKSKQDDRSCKKPSRLAHRHCPDGPHVDSSLRKGNAVIRTFDAP